MVNLCNAELSCRYVVEEINAPSKLEERLFHLGLYIGQEIVVILKAPFQGPFVILTNSHDKIALRPEEVCFIQVRDL